ncbi:MAG: glycerophosphoryl diester phosphodiesterase, partial [Bacteroidota bacterium]
GFSHRNRQGELSPTAYIPLLDHPDAQLEVGDSLSATFIYHLGSDGWFPALRLAMDSVYEISKRLALKENTQSLTTRIQRLLQYSLSDQTSFWQKMSFQNQPLGAQSYMGKVVGAEGDATKNSDIGAMWMMAKITDNKELIADRLPLVRNFKLLQQEPDADFFQGAARGQYYLSKSQRWVEEWGSHIEPIGVTYYTLADLSNILLFDPDDVEVRKAVQQGAERLLKWQQEDGSWVIGYDHQSLNPVYTDLQDLRPTFYGLMIAYQMLGEEKYLEAAKKGADWIIENSINKGHFLGVCGDLRFVNDFATAQTAQALLDLWELTEEEKYREAGIKTAKMYVSAIYSHPIASTETRKIRGRNLKGWQYTQAGLGFEHGGSIGSAASHGPILLSSHVGMFVRIAQLTGDRFFADLARAATWGRDAFVNPETGVASYYWVRMDQGAGNFPHHAWWQVGWIMDYLMAEASYRSDGLVHFPAGFMTAKVGPHKPYGFTPGTIGNDSVSLIFHPKTVQGLPPSTDLLMAKSTDNTSCYLILLQNDTEATDLSLQLNLQDILESNNWTSSVWDDEAKTFNPIVENKKKINLSILGAGIRIIKCQQQTS